MDGRCLTDAAAEAGRGRWRPGGEQRIPRPDAWSVVDEAPPFLTAPRLSTAEVVARLDDARHAHPIEPNFPEARPSAVLVTLADGDDGTAGVLLTRRSLLLRNHSGEISFPGGRIDVGESASDAACREADEEVGLSSRDIEVVGELTHLSTVVSRSYIVPVVARLASQLPLAPASIEVSRVLWVPLHDLVRTDTYRGERWGAPPGERVLHFFELDDETVWGATAFVLADLLARLT